MPSWVEGTPLYSRVSWAALPAAMRRASASARDFGTNTWIVGLSGPAARASASTLFSSAPQPSRIHTATSGPPSGGGSAPKYRESFRGSLHAPCRSRIDPTASCTAAPRSRARLPLMPVRSLASRCCRLRNSASHSLLSRVCRLYSSSSFISVPAAASSSRSAGSRPRNAAPSPARSCTSRSASTSAVARTPLSTPASRGSLRIRNTSAHSRDLSAPPGVPSSCPTMASWISRSSTPDCSRLAETSSNRKSAGTTVPTGSPAVRRMASYTMRSWVRSWPAVPARSTARNACSQKRRRTGSSG